MAAKIIRSAGGPSCLARRAKSAAMLASLVVFCAAKLPSDTRPSLLPQLKPGQTFLYEVHGRLNRSVKTESRVSSFKGPQQLQGDLSNQIRLSVQIVAAGKPHPTATVQTELLPASPAPTNSPASP